MCRYDYRMTWQEFTHTTLAEFEALEERRDVSIRYARFNAGLITAALVNSRSGSDSDPLSPFDFVPGMEDAEEKERNKLRQSVKHAVALAFTEMKGQTAEQVQQHKAQIVRGLTDSGIEDPEDLIREVFPDL